MSRESKVEGRALKCSRTRLASCSRPAAFTLIEIMVAVGIIAIILSIAIPSVYQQLHQDSMRQAIKDFTDACDAARGRAILSGIPTEVRVRPADHSISVVESAAPAAGPGGGPTYSFQGEELVEHRAGGGSIFSAKLSDHIILEYIGVNLDVDLRDLEEVSCVFYPNGTSDHFVVLLRSDRGEVRKIVTEVVTGIADVEVIK